jgi:putative membrane protein
MSTGSIDGGDFAKNERLYRGIIVVLSVAIPVVVAVLLFIPQTGKLGDINVSFLPHLNGVLNTATAVALLVGYYFIKNKNQEYHRLAMLSAFSISCIFLVSYVAYHFQAAPTKFGGTGIVKGIYYFLLLTHIVLAAVVVPFVLFSLYFALTKQIARHKKVVKYTFPIWLYVAVTGVIVYLMISPYYIH